MPSSSVTFNKRGKAVMNRRSRVVGDYTTRARTTEGGGVPSNAVLYNDFSPVLYNDFSNLLYNV